MEGQGDLTKCERKLGRRAEEDGRGGVGGRNCYRAIDISIHLPSGKALRAKGSSQFHSEKLPGDTVPLRCQGCRERLSGKGMGQGFLALFWPQPTTQMTAQFFVCFSLNLGCEVSWGWDSMLLCFGEVGSRDGLNFGCLEMALLLSALTVPLTVRRGDDVMQSGETPPCAHQCPQTQQALPMPSALAHTAPFANCYLVPQWPVKH